MGRLIGQKAALNVTEDAPSNALLDVPDFVAPIAPKTSGTSKSARLIGQKAAPNVTEDTPSTPLPARFSSRRVAGDAWFWRVAGDA
jgi:hypothetical protein